MTLVYIDPHCSGQQVVSCSDKKDIKKVLDTKGMNEDGCYGEVVYYTFVASDGEVTSGALDFT